MMRPNPKFSASKISICLVTTALGLVLVLCNSGRPEETAKAKSGIKELEQQRLEVLEHLQEAAENLFQNARIEYGELHDAQRDLLAARLEYADTREDRIKACDAAIEHAQKCVQLVQARKVAARASAFQELKAQAFLLEAQIAREKLETAK